MNQTQTTQPSENQTSFGCLTVLLILFILPLLFAIGYRWLFLIMPGLVESSAPRWQTDLQLALAFVFATGTIGVVSLLAMRNPVFRFWRGVGLTLTIAAGHALVGGGLLALDRALDWPGLPYLSSAMGQWVVAISAVFLLRRAYFGQRQPGLIFLGLFLGLLIGASFTLFGSLGSGLELFLALGEAMGLAAIASVLLTSTFYFAPDLLAQRPRLSGLLAALILAALAPSLLAVRGYWVQGQMLTFFLAASGLTAAVLFGLAQSPTVSRIWPATAALLFTALLLPLTLTEGLEGDFFLSELGFLANWLAAAGIGIVMALALALSLLLMQHFFPDLFRKGLATPRGTLVLAGVSAVAILFLYFGSGGSGLQAERFLLVLTDQVDTNFAATIENRGERVSAVYDTLTAHATTTQTALQARLTAENRPFTPFYLVNAIEVEGNRWARFQLGRDPAIDRVLNSPRPRPQRSQSFLEPEFPADLLPSDYTPGNLAWGVDQIDAERVWAELGVDGSGIIVGNADSGVEWSHRALRDNYLGRADNHDYTWLDPSGGSAEPTDTNGHGTHTIGTVLGRDGIGVAPGAKWIGCRNLATNLGNPADYLSCMQFLFAPYPRTGNALTDGDPLRGAHLTNNSWGCPPDEGCDNRTMGIGVDHLRNAGQMMVISSGNDGPTCETVWSPANATAGLSVGAINEAGEMAGFSSRGPAENENGDLIIKPDVVAPGVDIPSSWLNGGYSTSSGTSMAGPHVAGLVALIWSANPDLIGNIDATEALIVASAEAVANSIGCTPATPDKNNVSGYGSVNAFSAVEAALSWQPTPPTP